MSVLIFIPTIYNWDKNGISNLYLSAIYLFEEQVVKSDRNLCYSWEYLENFHMGETEKKLKTLDRANEICLGFSFKVAASFIQEIRIDSN